MVLYNYILQQEYLQKPIWDYVIEGPKNFFFGLRPTYLPNPQSGILMPKPPCLEYLPTKKEYTKYLQIADAHTSPFLRPFKQNYSRFK